MWVPLKCWSTSIGPRHNVPADCHPEYFSLYFHKQVIVLLNGMYILRKFIKVFWHSCSVYTWQYHTETRWTFGSVAQYQITKLKSIHYFCWLICANTVKTSTHSTLSIWYNQRHHFFQLIRLLAEVINISTAIMYELLLMLRNNSALKLSKLLEGLTLVCVCVT
jgi:hypothetical protein